MEGRVYPTEEVNYFLWGIIAAIGNQGAGELNLTTHVPVSITGGGAATMITINRYTGGLLLSAFYGTFSNDGDYRGIGRNLPGRQAWFWAGYYSYGTMMSFEGALRYAHVDSQALPLPPGTNKNRNSLDFYAGQASNSVPPDIRGSAPAGI